MDVKELKDNYENLRKETEAITKKCQELEADNKALQKAQGVYTGSQEKQILAKAGAKNIGELVRKNTAICHSLTESEKLQVMQLKSDIDTARFISQMFYGAPLDRKDIEEDKHAVAVKNIFESDFARQVDLMNRCKAFNTTDFNEWVPTAVASQYIEEYELQRKLQSMFRELPMPTNPYSLPVVSGVTEGRLIGEGASLADANFTSTNLLFQASKCGERYLLSEELNEDSAPAVLSIGRSELQAAHQRAIENALLNGDTTATHMDADVTLASDFRKAWKGLRKLALANAGGATVDFAGSAISTAKLDDMIVLAGKFGINPRDNIWVVSSNGYNQMLTLPEVTTVEKFGPQATILSGTLASFRARGIVISEYVRDDVNASGVHAGVPLNDIFTTVYYCNRLRFMIGRRRPLRMRVAMDSRSEYDRWEMVGYQRLDFQAHVQSATEKSVVLGVEVALA